MVWVTLFLVQCLEKISQRYWTIYTISKVDSYVSLSNGIQHALAQLCQESFACTYGLVDRNRTTSAILSALGSGKTIFPPLNSGTVQEPLINLAIWVLETVIPYISIQSIPYKFFVSLYIAFCVVTSMWIFSLTNKFIQQKMPKKICHAFTKMVNSYQWIVAGNIELDPFTKPPTLTPTRPMAPPELPRLQPWLPRMGTVRWPPRHWASPHRCRPTRRSWETCLAAKGNGVQVCDGRLFLLSARVGQLLIYNLYFGDGHSTSNDGNPNNGYLNPY